MKQKYLKKWYKKYQQGHFINNHLCFTKIIKIVNKKKGLSSFLLLMNILYEPYYRGE